MKQKLFSILTLLLGVCSGAWGTVVTVTLNGSTTRAANRTSENALVPTITASSTITTGACGSGFSNSGYYLNTNDNKTYAFGETTYYLSHAHNNGSKCKWTDAGTSNQYGTFTVPTGYTYTITKVSHALGAESADFTASIIVRDILNVAKYDSSGISVTSGSKPKTATDINLALGDQVILSEGTYTLNVTGSTTATSTGKYFGIAQVVLTGDLETVATGAYSITKGSATNGSIDVASSADEADDVAIAATPDTGYEFTSWNIYKTGDESTTVTPAAATASTSFSMPAYNVTVDANFSIVNYGITYSAADHGTYTLQVADGEAVSTNTTANYGQTITLAATPDDGYALISWGVTDEDDNEVTVTSNQFTMPAKAVTIAPVFAVVPDVDITTDLDASYSMIINTKKTFTVAASGGTGEYTYQWYENTSASTEGAEAISGKTTASYELNPTAAYDKYIYCVVTSGPNSATSAIAHVTASAITPVYKDFNGEETIFMTTSANFTTELANGWVSDGFGGGTFTSANTYSNRGNIKIVPVLTQTTEGETSDGAVKKDGLDIKNAYDNVGNLYPNAKTLVTYVTGVTSIKAYGISGGSSVRGVYVYAIENGETAIAAQAVATLKASTASTITTLVGLDPSKEYVVYYEGVDNASTNNGADLCLYALKFNPTPDETISLNANGFATFSNAKSVAFSGATACKAALDYENEAIALTPLTNNEAPAATGVILNGAASATVNVFYTGSATVDSNDLKATTDADGTTVEKGSNTYYVLSGNTFKKFTGDSFSAKKAYFEVDGDAVLARSFRIMFEDEAGETTAIAGVEAEKFVANNKFFSLSGQQVKKPSKGLYIVNGRKVVIK